jgi:plasmid stabilization system protein ParE
VIVRWTRRARKDVDRLADFVAAYDSVRADEIEHELSQAPRRLLQFPRRGSRLSEFEPREVREFRVGRYLLRYELAGDDIFVLRFFHGRENRYEGQG